MVLRADAISAGRFTTKAPRTQRSEKGKGGRSDPAVSIRVDSYRLASIYIGFHSTPQKSKPSPPRNARSLKPAKRNAPRPRLRNHGRLVEHDDPARLKCGGVQAGFAHDFECAQAEHRHVEPVVLMGLDRFYEERAVGLERPRAAQHFVGALEGFHGEHGALADDATLADVEPGGFACDEDAVFEILGVDGKFPARHDARRGEMIVQKTARIEHPDAVFFDFRRNRAENRLGIAAFQRKEDFDRAQIGMQPAEKPFGRNLPGHDRVTRAKLAKRAERFAELPDEHHAAIAFGEGVVKGWRRFFLESDEPDRHAGAADGLGNEHGITALARNKRDGFGGVEIWRKKTGWHWHDAKALCLAPSFWQGWKPQQRHPHKAQFLGIFTSCRNYRNICKDCFMLETGNSSTPENASAEGAEPLGALERDIIAYWVQTATLLGYPRSVGEIFGYIFLSEQPVNADDLVAHLGISRSGAGQGLKALLDIGAIRPAHNIPDRRDHYHMQSDLGVLVKQFLNVRVFPPLEALRRQRDTLKETVATSNNPHLVQRFDKLLRWQSKASPLLAVLKTLTN